MYFILSPLSNFTKSQEHEDGKSGRFPKPSRIFVSYQSLIMYLLRGYFNRKQQASNTETAYPLSAHWRQTEYIGINT